MRVSSWGYGVRALLVGSYGSESESKQQIAASRCWQDPWPCSKRRGTILRSTRGDSEACALCEELAPQVSRSPELLDAHPAFVPTKSLKLLPAAEVFIDDAPWSRSEEVELLHSRISEEAGRSLGCTSLRAKLAERCEADQLESDGFGPLSKLLAAIPSSVEPNAQRSHVEAEVKNQT